MSFVELVDPMMRAIAERRPAFAKLFAEGDQTIHSFIRSFASEALPPIQDRSDYIDQSVAEVSAAQGPAVGDLLKARLQRSPVVFTANHLCLECLPLTVQSMVLASLGEDPDGILPVEACGIIPADNASYPPGLLLTRQSEGKPIRIPILELGRKQRRQITLRLDPFHREDLVKTESKVSGLFLEGRISSAERDALMRVTSEILSSPQVLGLPTYREQASAVVPRLWGAWFSPEAQQTRPALAYTPSESIRVPLLILDLQKPETLASRILLDPRLREEIMVRLDGVPCCWTDGGRSGGSALFWQVGHDRRTSPLILEAGHLVGSEGHRIPLEAVALAEALQAGTLVPTIFLNLTLGLARGLVQIGGFSQIDYLATMQRGLSLALGACGYRDWADKLGTQLPPMLTAGLAGIAVDYSGSDLQTAGGIELISHGGLSLLELEGLKRLSLREAMALELPGITRMVLGEKAAAEIAIPTLQDLAGPLAEKLLVIHL